MFDLGKFIETVLGGIDIPGIEADIVTWLKEAEAKYPELQARIEALAAWLTNELETVVPKLVLNAMKNTILGIASDIVHGTAGVDPSAWMGGA